MGDWRNMKRKQSRLKAIRGVRGVKEKKKIIKGLWGGGCGGDERP